MKTGSKTFSRWKIHFLNQGAQAKQAPFKELKDSASHSSGISLNLGKLQINLSPDFDGATLKRLLGLIEGL